MLMMKRGSEPPDHYLLCRCGTDRGEELIQVMQHLSRQRMQSADGQCEITGSVIDQIIEILDGRTTVMAGPSGVGKSSMTNAMYPDAEMATGAVSEKIKRGRHTTRHSELFSIGNDTYLMDTPGFSTLYLEGSEKEDLKYYYPEFEAYFEHCRLMDAII